MKDPAPISSKQFPGLATWLNQLRDFALASRLQPSRKVKVNRTTGGTTLEFIQNPGGGSTASTSFPFEVFADDDVAQPTKRFVRVRRGNVYWNGKIIDVFNNVDNASPRIEVPALSVDFQIYLIINNPFTTGTPTFTASGAALLPSIPNPPAWKNWPLAICDLPAPVFPATVGTLSIELQWRGNDIPWAPVNGFWA